MTVEASIYTALQSLVGGRCFPDFAPNTTTRPYITYQQIGGDVVTYMGREVPNLLNGHVQINVWADSRAVAASTMLAVESAMTLSTAFQAKPLSAARASFDAEIPIYSASQDFSIWSDR